MQNNFLRSASTGIAILAAMIAVYSAVYALRFHGSGATAVAFINMQAVLSQSDAGRSLNAQIVPKQQALQKAAQAKVAELKAEQNEVAKNTGHLSEDKLKEETAAIQKKINDWNADAQKKDAALTKAANAALQKLQDSLREQLAVIASENNFIAILPGQEALYIRQSVDVTAETIRRLNDHLSKVDVQFEESE